MAAREVGLGAPPLPPKRTYLGNGDADPHDEMDHTAGTEAAAPTTPDWDIVKEAESLLPPVPGDFMQVQPDQLAPGDIFYVRGKRAWCLGVDYPHVYWRYDGEQQEYHRCMLFNGPMFTVTEKALLLNQTRYDKQQQAEHEERQRIEQRDQALRQERYLEDLRELRERQKTEREQMNREREQMRARQQLEDSQQQERERASGERALQASLPTPPGLQHMVTSTHEHTPAYLSAHNGGVSASAADESSNSPQKLDQLDDLQNLGSPPSIPSPALPVQAAVEGLRAQMQEVLESQRQLYTKLEGGNQMPVTLGVSHKAESQEEAMAARIKEAVTAHLDSEFRRLEKTLLEQEQDRAKRREVERAREAIEWEARVTALRLEWETQQAEKEADWKESERQLLKQREQWESEWASRVEFQTEQIKLLNMTTASVPAHPSPTAPSAPDSSPSPLKASTSSASLQRDSGGDSSKLGSTNTGTTGGGSFRAAFQRFLSPQASSGAAASAGLQTPERRGSASPRGSGSSPPGSPQSPLATIVPTACAVPSCICPGFAPQRWNRNKCHNCFHWNTHH